MQFGRAMAAVFAQYRERSLQEYASLQQRIYAASFGNLDLSILDDDFAVGQGGWLDARLLSVLAKLKYRCSF